MLIITLLSLFLYLHVSIMLGITSILFAFSLSTYKIYTKHVESEHARTKILKEVGVMVLTLVIILFLGGIAAMLANAQVSVRWGEVAGILSAIGASFGVGYIVRVGVGRFGR
ncbi:MAG: hypothetical protein H6634_04040 [Anaerolineales bacterium]|nr:hypothetical protein [Anaerolineales bacterium]